jgi:hypothetical protein
VCKAPGARSFINPSFLEKITPLVHPSGRSGHFPPCFGRLTPIARPRPCFLRLPSPHITDRLCALGQEWGVQVTGLLDV